MSRKLFIVSIAISGSNSILVEILLGSGALRGEVVGGGEGRLSRFPLSLDATGYHLISVTRDAASIQPRQQVSPGCGLLLL
jgi:hypothetical protein